MYSSIHVPLDNSDHSNAAMQLGVALGEAFEARLVGSHVYAAKLHDVRFKQMEFTLPDEYKEEKELEKQAKSPCAAHWKCHPGSASRSQREPKGGAR